VCDQAAVPLEVISLQQEYWSEVVGYTVREAKQGRTPNPDIMCNNRIKFGMFYDYVGRHFAKVATGHYAVVQQVELANGQSVTCLKRSPDPVKDQTYFLCGLSQSQLSRALFPVGALLKENVRQEAERFNLPTKNRPDSQGICFLGKLKFDDFLRAHLGESIGDCYDLESGALIGQHRGLWFHTIGQRKGLGTVLYPSQIYAGPWYVAAKDMTSNTLYVTNNYAAVSGERTQFRVEGLRWIDPHFDTTAFAAATSSSSDSSSNSSNSNRQQLLVKTRHGPAIKRCELVLDSNSSNSSSSSISSSGSVSSNNSSSSVTSGTCRLLEGRDSGLAPGQYAAFYYSDVCIGSGVIASAVDVDHTEVLAHTANASSSSSSSSTSSNAESIEVAAAVR
jgi:tRNA-5-taurinomethyluridine 2-sulfurtransferase